MHLKYLTVFHIVTEFIATLLYYSIMISDTTDM